MGTYTNKNNPQSEGIYEYQLKNNGTLDSIRLLVKTENPTYLIKSFDKNFLLTTNSQWDGTISSFKIEPESLKEISISKADKSPCYIAINKDNYVLTANYNSGTTNLHRLNEKGELVGPLDTQQNEITVPSNNKRQDFPHAHSCYFEPNSENIISVDLGANKLVFSTIDKDFNKFVPNEFHELQMPGECGPRILTFHPTQPWIYSVNELDGTVTFIKKNIPNNSYKIIQTVKTLPDDFKEINWAAHITITKDGKYVYMSNRGHDSIGILKVLPSGKLELIDTISTHGKHPRNFSLTPDEKFLIVANRDTNNICSFRRNSKTGKLTFVDEVLAPRPVSILF
ncbi:hypothetical protein AXE80_05065 [Wenyingzhuangia fucanilytica]|uniref:6-phosphogluconolactonase n=1 Tax=Wenyingzhuangia fucanilytica TaxID=1790137 RepID=A0A1B1Y4I2_9FLAO|nr:hypothetical protein AXE80_05065 [Wenyingzhuangia fucanilytica]